MLSKKRMSFAIACVVLLTMVLSGCGGSANKAGNEASQAPATEAASSSTAPAAETPAETAAELPPVELSYYFGADLQSVKGIQLVEDEMNKIIKPKINATIKLNPIDWGAFDQKMNIKNSAAEPYDLVFTANWSNSYYQNVAKGALLPLDDLLAQYAPKLKAMVPDKVWEATKVNKAIYGVVNWQIVAMSFGVMVPQQYMDKYNVDINAINSPKDLEPYFAKWQEKWPAFHGGDTFTSAAPLFGFDTIGDVTTAGWVRLNDAKLQVVNQFDTPEFKDLIALYRGWEEKGYIPKDAPLYTEQMRNADRKAGKPDFVLGYAAPIKPGVEAEVKQSIGLDIVTKALTKPLLTTDRVTATLTGISKTSKNPERAMMYLELLNSDKALYNLLANGIEGKHYKLVDAAAGVIEKIPDSGYNPSTDWEFGNQFLGYYTNAGSVGNWEKTIKQNLEADASPLIGFSFDPEPIKSELAQVASVWQEYKSAFMTGTVDWTKKYPEFLEKLNKAGVAKVIAEKQRQIDEWVKSK